MERPKVEDEKEVTTVKEEVQEAEIVADLTSPPPIIYYETSKIARDAKAKKKDEKTVQQVLKSLDNLKTPEDKLSAMCKKYSELLHENRQLHGTVKQSEKNITIIHREKEQFRHARSKAVLAKTRMEQLCRELQKLNKAQQEETALKLRVEEEKRKEICITFQSAFAEMNTLTNQNNEKSVKMREENLEMREKIRSVKERIELTEIQLDKVRQQAKLELELAREKLEKVTLELTSEKDVLMEDKNQLLMKLAKYHVRVKEYEGTEQFLRKQISIYEEKFEDFKKDVKKTTESLKNFRPESREMKKKMLKLEKETALWKQRWEKTNAAVLQMTEIKEKRDAEMVTLNNKLLTLQELCKVFQRERTSLLAQLREKNDVEPDRKSLRYDENRKSMQQVENISNDCEKVKDNLSKLEGSLSEAVREAFKGTAYNEDSPADQSPKSNKKVHKKTKKNETRNQLNEKKVEKASGINSFIDSNSIANNTTTSPITEQSANDQTMKKSDASKDKKTEGCAAEITILKRQGIVLKDIEKVLTQQATSEIEMLCMEEAGTMITEANSEAHCPTTETALLDNEQPKFLPISSALLGIMTTKMSLGNKTVEDSSLPIAEFESVDPGFCMPDGAVPMTGNQLSTALDNEKIINQPKLPVSLSDSVTMIETVQAPEHISEPTEATSDGLKILLIDSTSLKTAIEQELA